MRLVDVEGLRHFDEVDALPARAAAEAVALFVERRGDVFLVNGFDVVHEAEAHLVRGRFAEGDVLRRVGVVRVVGRVVPPVVRTIFDPFGMNSMSLKRYVVCQLKSYFGTSSRTLEEPSG